MTGSAGPWTGSYAPGVPAALADRPGTLTDLIEASVETYPDRVALEFFGTAITYRTLGRRIAAFAQRLRDLGVGPGDRVALVLPNCPQHVIAFYAILRLGGVVIEHNPLYTADELRTQFADHGARVAVVWDVASPRVAARY